MKYTVKKMIAIMLFMALISMPTKIMAGQSSNSGTVSGGYTFDASLQVSDSAATATLMASHSTVKFTGNANAQYANSTSFTTIPISMDGTSYYISQTVNKLNGTRIISAGVKYYVNTVFATVLSAPA